jgi:cell division protein FtsQ
MASKIFPYLRKSLYVLSIRILLVILYIFHKNQQNQICTFVEIKIEAPAQKELITQEIIKNKLDKWYIGGLSGVPQNSISLLDIEKKLEQIPAVKDAEVSFDLKGELTIDIRQHIPLVRIMSPKTASYYLAENALKIPSKDVDIARVPVVNDYCSPEMIKKVYTLSTYVYENAFIDAITEQIFVENGDLIIIPKINNQKIVIGDTNNIPEKFEKLTDFYVDGLNHVGWNKYQIIDLKYKNQIVCK